MNRYEHRAKWWQAAENGKVECGLCPRQCRIAPGRNGYCGVRTNLDGILYSLSYGYPVALQVDPIEKKPLAEFMPGTKTFSLGTYGCNLGCRFCQNYHLSRGSYPDDHAIDYTAPELIVRLARQYDCRSVAFTYNEPTVFAEYAIDIAGLAHRDGLATVLVSNGYITPAATAELYPLIDAANIDMKGFSEDFYRDMTQSELQPVLDAMKCFYGLGKHLEITNLVIPGKNDAEEMIQAFLDWVERELNRDIPLHFSAYHPDYQYHDSPPTSAATLRRIRDSGRQRGFNHIYLGNIVVPE